MNEESLPVNQDGTIQLDDENFVKSLINSFGHNNYIKIVVAFDTENVKAKEWCKLICNIALTWAKSIKWINEPMAKPVVCSFIANKDYRLGLLVQVNDEDQNKYTLQCLNRNGFAYRRMEILKLIQNHISESQDNSDSVKVEKSSQLKKCAGTKVYSQLVGTFSEMAMLSALEVIACSNMKFAFLINAKPIQEYIKHCANLFSLQFEVVHASDGWPWPLEETRREQEIHCRLSDYHQHAIHQANILFCITDDGQQMAVATVAKKNLFVLSDQEVICLLTWWATVRLQSELEYNTFRVANPVEETNLPKHDDDTKFLVDAFAKVGLVGDDSHICKLAEKDNLFELIKVRRIDEIVGEARRKIEKEDSNWHNKFTLGWDTHRRYLCGTRTWDGVAASIQLAHIAIFAKAISRCSLRQLLASLKLRNK